MGEEEDLYADLYNEDAGTGAGETRPDDDDTALYEDDAPTASTTTSLTTTAAAPTAAPKKSFIPAAPAMANSTPAEGGARTSFIPPASSSSQQAAPSTLPGSNYGQQTSQQHNQPAPIPSFVSSDNTASAVQTLGGGGGGGYQQQQQGHTQNRTTPADMPEDGKMFVGGLNWDTTDESLKRYFTQFGNVTHCLVMRDSQTGRSRGFAFLTFEDPKAVNSVMVREHFLDGKIIDPKRAIPRMEHAKTSKCFVGGVPQTATQESFRAFFSQFGAVLDATLMVDRETQRPRGYGFITFDDEDTVDRLIQMGQTDNPVVMDGKQVEVKRATPRNADGSKKVPDRADRRRDMMSSGGAGTMMGGGSMSGMGGMSGIGGMGGMGGMAGMGNMGGMNAFMSNPMMAGMMGGDPSQQQQSSMFGGQGGPGGGGFDPQAMANFFQSQGWGSANFNPMAFQQQMMMMGMMGGAGGAGANGMLGGQFGSGQQGGSGMYGGQGGYAGQGSMSPSSQSRPGLTQGARSSSSSTNGGGGGGGTVHNNNADKTPLPAAHASAGLPTKPGSGGRSSRSPVRGDRGQGERDPYLRERSPSRATSGGPAPSSSKKDRW